MAGKSKKSKEKSGKKKKSRGLSLLACLGGCGGKVAREDMMDEVTQLDFRHHSLTEVPSDVFACECTLETLFLDSNQLSELPRELFHCHGLQTLTLSDNELKNLPPAMAALTALQSLDVSKNNLSGIPDSIKCCRELRSVDASVNPMGRLPEGFTQLIALKELFLNDTFLEYLPANFGRLVGLEVLELRENQLNTLPKSLARLTKLKRLDIGSNEFSQLPEVVGSLSGLTELWFDNNRVRSVAPFMGSLSELSYLDGSNNRIDSLPDEIAKCTKLTDLHLSGNHLKSVPSSLSGCSSLQVLRLDDNALGELPHDIGSLSNLTELVLTQNDLESLPSSIGLLRSLHTLHADDNVLTSVPSEIGSCVKLSVLTLASNRLDALPPELGHLNSLKVLNVWDNSIRNLPVSFSKLKLLALWLSDNQAKPSVQLQTETDPLTGQKVLTCYMLPQQPSDRREEDWSKEKDEPFPMANWEEKHRARSSIKFAFDDDEAKTGAKLSRAPTPYPKELRALAKHARNLAGGGKEDGAGKRGSREENSEDKRSSRAEDGGLTSGEVRGRREQAMAGSGESNNTATSSADSCSATEQPAKVELVMGSGATVKAEYQAAAATVQKSSEFSGQPVVRTATKTSPKSVVVGCASPQHSPPLREEGLVAPPVEEQPPLLKEARTVLQSDASPLKPSSKAPNNRGVAAPHEQQQLQPNLRQKQEMLRELNKSPAARSTSSDPAVVSYKTERTSDHPKRLGSSGSCDSNDGSVAGRHLAKEIVSDDETPADLLAEALAVADDVAGINRQTTVLEDPADRSSTDSGYCRPSHNTNSLNDVSDQSCDLVSPVSSLPPETPTSPANSTSNQQDTFTYNSQKQSPLASPQTMNNISAPPPQQLSPIVRTSLAESPLQQPGYSTSPAPDPQIQTFSNSPGYQQPRPGSLALASLAESGVLSDRAGYINRPGSLAAPCNTLGIPPAPPARATSAATGLNHQHTSPARQTFSPSPVSPSLMTRPGEATAPGGSKPLNGGLYTIQQDSPTSPTPLSINATFTIPVVSPNDSSHFDSPHNLSSSSIQETKSNSSYNYVPTSAATKYSSQSRIPMNKQISSSSIGDQSTHSNDSSRIPSYGTQLSNKSESGENGSKVPDASSRIPSLSSTGRSYSNLSNKSVNQQDQYRNYNNAGPANGRDTSFEARESGIKLPSSGSYKQTPPKESRIPYSGQSPNYNNGAKSQSQITAPGNVRNNSIKNSSIPSLNGSGLQAPSKTSAIPSLSYSSGIPASKKSSGIPAPSYSRSNSTLSNADSKDSTSRIPAMNSSFGKSNISASNGGPSPASNLSKMSSTRHNSYSPNTSFDSTKDHRIILPTAQSRLSNPSSSYASGLGYKGPPSGVAPSYRTSSAAELVTSPVNQAINTPGLPPLPALAATDGRRSSISQLQQPKPVATPSSRIPQFGGNNPSSATAAPSSLVVNHHHQQQHPQYQQHNQPQYQQLHQRHPLQQQQSVARQPNAWMFGSHQNARVFPVVIEKNPGPGFELAQTSQPEQCVFVSSVVANGPASSALKPGDKILQLDGETITDVDHDTFSSLAAPNSDTITLLVSRLH